MTFATPAELADRLGITLTTPEQTRAGGLLTLASGLIQTEAKQRIERVANDPLARRGTEESRIRLPQRPVVSVASVTLAGTLVPSDDWYLEGDELVRESVLASAGFAGVPGGGWGHPDQSLVIVYTHGFDPIPDAIKAVCLEAVVRVWVNPGSVMQEGYGSERVAYLQQGTPTGLLLTDAEKETVCYAVRRGAGSVALR